jgi:hypothetical protein
MNDECGCDLACSVVVHRHVLKSFGKRYKYHGRKHVRIEFFLNTFTLERTELFAEKRAWHCVPVA